MNKALDSIEVEKIPEGLITDDTVIASLEEIEPHEGHVLQIGLSGGYEWLNDKRPTGKLQVVIEELIGDKWKKAQVRVPFAYGFFQGSYWKFWKRHAQGERQPAFVAQKMKLASTGATPKENKKHGESQSASFEPPRYGDFRNLTGFSDQDLARINLPPPFTYGSEEEKSAALHSFEDVVRQEIARLAGEKNWLNYELMNAYFGIRGVSGETEWGQFFKQLRTSDFSPQSLNILSSPLSSKLYYLGWLKVLSDDAKSHGENRKPYIIFSALVKALYGDQLPFPYAEPVTEEEILAGKLSPSKS